MPSEAQVSQSDNSSEESSEAKNSTNPGSGEQSPEVVVESFDVKDARRLKAVQRKYLDQHQEARYAALRQKILELEAAAAHADEIRYLEIVSKLVTFLQRHPEARYAALRQKLAEFETAEEKADEGRYLGIVRKLNVFLEQHQEEHYVTLKEKIAKLEAASNNDKNHYLEIVNKLKAFLPTTQQEAPEAGDAEEKAVPVPVVKEEFALVDRLRRDLTQIAQQGKTKSLCDHVFQVQLMLAEHLPANEIEEDEGNGTLTLIDPVSREALPFLRVPSISGYLFDGPYLATTFKRDTGYVTEERELRLKNPLERRSFSAREVLFFEKSGIFDHMHDGRLDDALDSARTQLGVEEEILSFKERIKRGLRFFSSWTALSHSRPVRWFVKGASEGATLGVLLGFIVGFFFITLVVAAVLFAQPMSLPAIFLGALLCAYLERRRQDGLGMCRGFLIGLVGGSLIFFFASIGPVLLAGLGFSAAAAAAWTLVIQPLMPAVVALLATAWEILRPSPGALQKTFSSIIGICYRAPILLGVHACGLVGGVLGGLMGLGVSLISCFRRRRRLPPPNEFSDDEDSDDEVDDVDLDEVYLSQGARIRLALLLHAPASPFSREPQPVAAPSPPSDSHSAPSPRQPNPAMIYTPRTKSLLRLAILDGREEGEELDPLSLQQLRELEGNSASQGSAENVPRPLSPVRTA